MSVADLGTKSREITLLNRGSPPRIPSSMITGDIERSSPARRIPLAEPPRWHDQHGKCGSLTCKDIAGTASISRHVQRHNKPDRITSCSDIHGTRPDATNRLKNGLSKRVVDPIAPQYELPSWTPAPMAKMPPARNVNGIHVDGIDGAVPNIRYLKVQQRNSTFLNNDVAGAQVPKRRLYKDRRSPLNVKDIQNDPEGGGHVFRTTRQTNGLDPRYTWDVPEGVPDWKIGKIDGDKPKPLMNASDAPSVLYSKAMPPKPDIDRSHPKTLHALQLNRASAAYEYLEQDRREVRNTNHAKDIEKAEASSIRPGITTKRTTDPLQPDYVWPGMAADLGNDRFCHTPEKAPTPTPTLTRVAPAAPPIPVIPKDQAELDDSLRRVKDVFHQRGAYAGRALARVVRNFDDGDGHINKEELQHGLTTYLGFPLEQQDFDHVWKYFDKDDSGQIDVSEFLHGIRGNLNQRRMQAVLDTYEKIDRDQSGNITLNEVEALYDVTNHPKVLSGEWTRQEAVEDFVQMWDSDANGGVTRQEFIDYFRDVSLSMKEDHEFVTAMKHIFPSVAPMDAAPDYQAPHHVYHVADDEEQYLTRPSHTPDGSLSKGRLTKAKQREGSRVSTQQNASQKAEDVDAVRNICTPASTSRQIYND